MRAAPNVFSLEPGPGGLSRLIGALMRGEICGIPFGEAPEQLADLVVFLPHKRLRSAFEAALRDTLGPRPVILPQMRLLGAPDETSALEEAEDWALLAAERRIISPLERRFELLPLVSQWRGRLGGASDESVTLRERLALAGALGRLIDEAIIANVPLSRLESVRPPGYDPARFDDYWQLSRDFLRIAAQFWPERLAELGGMDARAAQLERLEAQAKALENTATPMLVLGSTGSVAATGKLMCAISRLDHGAVVLPGLDTRLGAADFELIGAVKRAEVTLATQFAHPQAILKRTLSEIGVPREAVKVLAAEAAQAPRLDALSDLMRPAESIAGWRESRPKLDETAFDGITVIEAQDEQEEALAIALAMRETLQVPGRRVALISPDKVLARRVQHELQRWGIIAANGAGHSLRESEAGAFLLLLLEAAAEAPGALLALLMHPLARFGFARAELELLTEALDLAVLRGHRFMAGAPLAQRIPAALGAIGRHSHPGVQRLDAAVLSALPTLAKVLDDVFAPLRAGAEARSFPASAACLADALEAATRDESGAAHIAASPDGGAVLALLAQIEGQPGHGAVAVSSLPAALSLLLEETPLPPLEDEHPRALLIGPFEARLLEVDRVILGALNEGQFPPGAADDPFLNRAMRLGLGLPAPEWRLGASAHDFAQLAATPDLILARAKRLREAPSLPSRFLRRLEAYAGKNAWAAMTARGKRYGTFARALDALQAPPPPVPRPCPVPAAPRVPQRLSVTEVETLRRDPYAIYARHILGLVPLEAPEQAPDPRDRGTIMHRILERYAAEAPSAEPQAARRRLEAIAEEEFRVLKNEPELFEFWRRRFEGIAADFIAFDRAAREAGHALQLEARGELDIALAQGSLRLVGKADRIERDTQGRLAILDFKTGHAPSNKDITEGRAPQLPLLGAMALEGAFGPVEALSMLSHIEIAGKAGFNPVPVHAEDLAALSRERLDWLRERLGALEAGAQGYLAQAEPNKARAGDFDHLTRRVLWSGTDEGTEEAP